MAALLVKLAITLMVALAWWTSGAPIEAERLRRRLAWTLGAAVALRLALELLGRAPAGDLREAAAFLSGIVAIPLLWPLLQLALAGPLTKPGRIVRGAFSAIGIVVLWGAGPGNSMFLFWLALTRCAWPPALRTSERFFASLASLAVGLGLLLGVHRASELSRAAGAAEGLAWFVRGLGIVFALYASTAAFKAFTADPTLGVRRVTRRLVISHVLVVTVPLVIVLALWVSSSYLGANADRALVTVRAIDREGARLEESLNIALQEPDQALGAQL